LSEINNSYYNRGASYHRNILNLLIDNFRYLYKRVVLDIEGRNRGIFKELKNRVEKSIIADIDRDTNPDIVLDIANMDQIGSNSIDVVNAHELFEHV